ncbi:MAG: transcription termination/antitermination NusG family protein [Phascolarctobacterium sp.]
MGSVAFRILMEEEVRQEKHWYVIHTYSGYENKVSANLERKVHSRMENEIFRIVIPMEKELNLTKTAKKEWLNAKYSLVMYCGNDCKRP